MRILVISDIHANLTAFEAVLEDAKGEWEYVWCLGDVVGHGPDPNECIDRLKALPHLCVAGDQDWAALGRLDTRSFNPDDRHAVEWTINRLSSGSAAYLADLPVTVTMGDYTLLHAGPREPFYEYILEPLIAALNFPHFETAYCFVGHSFQAAVFELINETGETIAHPLPYREPFSPGKPRLILNPGSVGIRTYGQPFRAAYALLNLKTCQIQHRTVAYDGESVVARAVRLGAVLPTQSHQTVLTWH